MMLCTVCWIGERKKKEKRPIREGEERRGKEREGEREREK
jgi:hypothetical protein